MDEEDVLTVPGRYDQIRTITQFVTSAAEAAGLDEDTVFHFELCCDEASTNIIEHAYGAEALGNITVFYKSSSRAFSVTLIDHGRPFNPKDVPAPASFSLSNETKEPALSEFLDNLQIGGLGIHFMRSLMDEVHYSFGGDAGNRLTLVKYIPRGSEQ